MTTPTPAKLSDGELKEILSALERYGFTVAAPQLKAHIDALAAENAWLTAELAEVKASQIRIMRTYDPNCDVFVEADEIEKMKAAAQLVEEVQKLAEHLGRDPEGCLTDCVDETIGKLAELAAAQQRLAALAVDPTQLDELGKLVRAVWIDWAVQQPICKESWKASYDELSESDKEVDRRIGETLHAAGRLSRAADLAAKDAEIERLKQGIIKQSEEVCQTLGRALGYPRFCDHQENFPGSTDADGVCVGEHVAETLAAEAAEKVTELQRQLDAATKRLAELAEPKDAEALAKMIYEKLSPIASQWHPWSSIKDSDQAKYIDAAKAVRAESAKKIADQKRRIDTLNTQVETAEAALDKLADAKGAKVTVAGESIAMADFLVTSAIGKIAELTAKLEAAERNMKRLNLYIKEEGERLRADRDRLAAELALYSEACGHLSDLVDELECTLEDEEASHSETIRLWDIAKTELATTKQALSDKSSELQRLRKCVTELYETVSNLLSARWSSDPAVCNTAWREAETAIERAYSLLAAPAAAEPPVAEHSGDAAEKVKAAESRFVSNSPSLNRLVTHLGFENFKCPKCGSSFFRTTNHNWREKGEPQKLKCKGVFDIAIKEYVRCDWQGTWQEMKEQNEQDKATEQPERPAFVCPTCSSTFFRTLRHASETSPQVLKCKGHWTGTRGYTGCNWSGTWADVAPDHSGDVAENVAVDELLKVDSSWKPIKRAAYVCRKCGDVGRLHPQTTDIWGCLSCGFSTFAVFSYFQEHVADGPGEKADVAAARGDDLTLASLKRHGAEQRAGDAARGQAGDAVVVHAKTVDGKPLTEEQVRALHEYVNAHQNVKPFCPWCECVFEPGEEAFIVVAQGHLKTCVNHPMRALEKKLDAERQRADAAEQKLAALTRVMPGNDDGWWVAVLDNGLPAMIAQDLRAMENSIGDLIDEVGYNPQVVHVVPASALEILQRQSEALRQRADAAVASAAVLFDAVRDAHVEMICLAEQCNFRKGGSADRALQKLKAAKATNAGAALAERLRRAEICIGEVRDALCRTESLHWVERALAKYDQASQPAEGK